MDIISFFSSESAESARHYLTPVFFWGTNRAFEILPLGIWCVQCNLSASLVGGTQVNSARTRHTYLQRMRGAIQFLIYI